MRGRLYLPTFAIAALAGWLGWQGWTDSGPRQPVDRGRPVISWPGPVVLVFVAGGVRHRATSASPAAAAARARRTCWTWPTCCSTPPWLCRSSCCSGRARRRCSPARAVAGAAAGRRRAGLVLRRAGGGRHRRGGLACAPGQSQDHRPMAAARRAPLAGRTEHPHDLPGPSAGACQLPDLGHSRARDRIERSHPGGGPDRLRLPRRPAARERPLDVRMGRPDHDQPGVPPHSSHARLAGSTSISAPSSRAGTCSRAGRSSRCAPAGGPSARPGWRGGRYRSSRRERASGSAGQCSASWLSRSLRPGRRSDDRYPYPPGITARRAAAGCCSSATPDCWPPPGSCTCTCGTSPTGTSPTLHVLFLVQAGAALVAAVLLLVDPQPAGRARVGGADGRHHRGLRARPARWGSSVSTSRSARRSPTGR